ncbi:MAG TPA: hypothetical protein QF861_11545, partial [Alphaproteobacteria bacterium]|nr:hypothetical protein [Alphaproteobacteria bacterium]
MSVVGLRSSIFCQSGRAAVMRQQLGLAKALEIGHEATRRLGGDMGKSYSDFGPDTTWRDCATPS